MAFLDDLQVHYRFNDDGGGGVSMVDVHGANDLTANNSPTLGTGKLEGGLSLAAASSQYASHADHAAFSLEGAACTITAWIKLASLGQQAGIVGKWNVGGYEYVVQMQIDDIVYAYIADGAVSAAASTFGALSVDTWYFVLFESDNANNISVSVNGVANTGSGDVIAASSSEFRIGSNENDASYFDGIIDSVSIWKRVLTAGEKTSLYNGGAGLDYPFVVASSVVPQIMHNRRMGVA